MRLDLVHVWCPFLLCALVPAQAAGLRAGSQEPVLVPRLPPPDAAAAERVITIEAAAEVRVPASELRVVFAASARGPAAAEANTRGAQLLEAVRARLLGANVAATDIDTDFIAIAPVYGWRVQKQADRDVLVEERTGFRIQHNLHVRVLDEAAAAAVIAAAHEIEGIDVLAVDYWSDQLEARQREAQAKALAAAHQKSKLLLSTFDPQPKAINVHEATRVLFPQHLYQTLPRAEENAPGYYGDRLPQVAASRPMRVYFRGLFADVEGVEPAMPGRREIHIVSTVRLYYAAPDRPAVVDK